jgi:tetraacyldisaccharide 4'-kinase
MKRPDEQFIRRLMSGEDRRATSALLRAALATAEPAYAAVMRFRNSLYDASVLSARQLPIPVISVGNITAGGAGKTPCVQWLYRRLQTMNIQPAVLMRGYRHGKSAISDEQVLLQEQLSAIVEADPHRLAAGRRVLRDHPGVDLFLLDDGFQHRRLARDFDLVLIDATNPFGYGHVHPRGLLREPMRGLSRADAFVLTRSDLISADRRREIEATLIGLNHVAPIYLARHAHTGVRKSESEETVSLSALQPRHFFAAAGIANPEPLHQQLGNLPGDYRGGRWLADHHDYSDADLAELRSAAQKAGADTLLVTEKDWVKIRRLPSAQSFDMPIWRLQLDFQLDDQAAEGLIQLILTRLDKARHAQQKSH